jgi:hypothetical protein
MSNGGAEAPWTARYRTGTGGNYVTGPQHEQIASVNAAHQAAEPLGSQLLGAASAPAELSLVMDARFPSSWRE